jgi:glycosyltransferase involved in cell wall biosynthesis
MRILALSDHTRHELGCAAALKKVGFEIVYVNFGSFYPFFNPNAQLVNVHSDEGNIPVPFRAFKLAGPFFNHILSISRIIEVSGIPTTDFDCVIASPQTPFYVGLRIARDHSIPLLLRIHTVRNTKISDYLRIGRTTELLKYIPSAVHSAFQILMSSKSIVLDHVVSEFLQRTTPGDYPVVYPTYSAVYDHEMEKNLTSTGYLDTLEAVEGQRNVLAIASYNARNPSLRFESDLIATLVGIAKKNTDINVLVVGTSDGDFQEISETKKPENLRFLGRIYSDLVLRSLYESSELVVCPVMQCAVSNRLLEGLFYSKPIMTNSVSARLHPELKHMKNVYISDKYDEYGEQVGRLLGSDRELQDLSRGAAIVYKERFSMEKCGASMKRIVEDAVTS